VGDASLFVSNILFSWPNWHANQCESCSKIWKKGKHLKSCGSLTTKFQTSMLVALVFVEISTLLFAFGKSYWFLVVARAIQGAKYQ
jgi:hypothetical protein